MRVGINGLGRIGRLVVRAALGGVWREESDPRAGNRLDIVHVNELKGGAEAAAHLLAFDSVHGRWRAPIAAEDADGLRIGDRRLGFTAAADPAVVPGAISAATSCWNAPANSCSGIGWKAISGAARSG